MWFRLRPSAWQGAAWRWRVLAVPRDAVAHLVIWGAALIVVGAFAWILADVLEHGASRLSAELLTSAPSDAGRAGGIAPILVSTAWILVVCLSVALPLGLASAVLLAEFARDANGFGRLVRRSLDVLAGLKSASADGSAAKASPSARRRQTAIAGVEVSRPRTFTRSRSACGRGRRARA